MAETHGAPSDGAECAACYEDLSTENYVEYQQVEGGPWLPSLFCQECVTRLLERKWQEYTESITKTDCAAEWRRLVDRGPPINLREPQALPCPDDGEVQSLWYASDGQVHSAKLQGSLTGDERKAYWDHLLTFKAAMAATPAGPGEEAAPPSSSNDGFKLPWFST